MSRQSMRRPWVGGNWKMHGTLAFAQTLCERVRESVPSKVDVIICPPFPYIHEVERLAKNRYMTGAQNVSVEQEPGAYTGEVSAAMLQDAGAKWALLGHSERRQYYADSNQSVARRFANSVKAGLWPVLCVGETLAERQQGKTRVILKAQLETVLELVDIADFKHAVIAYEPVWAIGTGQTASPEDVQQIHAYLRSLLQEIDVTIARSVRIVYGGSVKPVNAFDLFVQPDVDGGLIGGAALEAADFVEICAAASRITTVAD